MIKLIHLLRDFWDEKWNEFHSYADYRELYIKPNLSMKKQFLSLVNIVECKYAMIPALSGEKTHATGIMLAP